MPYPESSRDASPRTETYPCGREALDAAFSNAGVESVDLVYFLRAGIKDWKAGDAVLLNVEFRASTRDRSERIDVRVHAIPSDRNRAVEPAIPTALRRIAEWYGEQSCRRTRGVAPTMRSSPDGAERASLSASGNDARSCPRTPAP